MRKGKQTMKVAILYICTGKYDIFWEEFYKSSEKYFLSKSDKEYFVFTDAESIYEENNSKIHKIYQENLNWPGNTLFRFKMFNKITDQLEKFDYIFFINANALFLKEVSEDILPREESLIVVQHPGFYNKERYQFTYDNNPQSLAYIPEDKGQVYVCGGFNGGTKNAYISLIKDLQRNIDEDYKNGIVALWHDESHINKYILEHKYKLLGPEYMSPEEKEMPFEKIVIVRDKNKYGGHDFLRGNKVSTLIKIKNIIKKWRSNG